MRVHHLWWQSWCYKVQESRNGTNMDKPLTPLANHNISPLLHLFLCCFSLVISCHLLSSLVISCLSLSVYVSIVSSMFTGQKWHLSWPPCPHRGKDSSGLGLVSTHQGSSSMIVENESTWDDNPHTWTISKYRHRWKTIWGSMKYLHLQWTVIDGYPWLWRITLVINISSCLDALFECGRTQGWREQVPREGPMAVRSFCQFHNCAC